MGLNKVGDAVRRVRIGRSPQQLNKFQWWKDSFGSNCDNNNETVHAHVIRQDNTYLT